MLERILYWCLIFFVYNNILLSYVQAQVDRVKLSDIQALTLRKGIYTTARRTPPVLQLQCSGGSAGCFRQPDVVQCYNRGLNDKNNVQWECKAELQRGIIFGSLKVSCEGYAFSGDPYVLAGSCGLLYSLVNQNVSQQSGGIIGSIIGAIVLIIGVIVGVVCCFQCYRNSSPLPYQAPVVVPGPTAYYPPGPHGTTIVTNPPLYAPAPAPYYNPHHYNNYHQHTVRYSGGVGGTHESSGFADSETR